MMRRPPGATRTDTRVPCAALCRCRRLAREAAGEEGGDDIRAHVGWYLADAGLPQLERDLGLRRWPLASIRSGWRHTPLLAYILPLAALLALFAPSLMAAASAIPTPLGLLWLVGLLSVLPSRALGVVRVHWVASLLGLPRA